MAGAPRQISRASPVVLLSSNRRMKPRSMGRCATSPAFGSRFTIVNGGEGLEVKVHVQDPGAFTMPWNAVQRYRRDQRKEEVPLHEMVCAENNGDHFNHGLVPIPQADKSDF